MLISNHFSMSATKNSSSKEDVISIEQRMLQKKDNKEKSVTNSVPEEDKNKEILHKLMFQIVMNDFMTFTFSPDEDQEPVNEW